jgi:hypothetical protein
MEKSWLVSSNSERLRYRQLLFLEDFGLGRQFGQILCIGFQRLPVLQDALSLSR